MQSRDNTVQKSSQGKSDREGAKSSAAPSGNVQRKKAASGAEGFDAQSAALAPPEDWAPVASASPAGHPVQAKGQPAGDVSASPAAAAGDVSASPAAAAGDVHAAAQQGIASGGGALPHLGAVQQAFGRHDVSNVQAHTGAAAADASKAMGAEAYATGDHVAFGGGGTDLHTVAHEAAHVVQQRGGVSLSDGVGQSGDAYEQHADQVADAVVKGQSAEPILDKMAGGGGGGGGATQHKAIQRKTVSQGAELQSVQEKLNKLGFDCGKPDGIMGAKTRGAIKAFQGSKGLVADGVCGDKTTAALDEAAGGGGGATPAGGGGGAEPTPKNPALGGQDNGQGGPANVTPGGGASGGGAPGKEETKAGKTDDANTPGAKDGGQADGLDKKKDEAKDPAKHVKPSPDEIAKKEAEFSSEGTSAFAAVKGEAGGRLGSGGDTVGGSVAGYPSWFGEMQDWLVNSAKWTESHEKAQNVLYRYAMWKTEVDLGYVPASVEMFFRYIGRSSGNTASATKAGKKGAEDLGGYTNGKNWCAQATSAAAEKALKERGLKFKGGVAAWIQGGFGKAQGGSYWCTKCNGVDLGSGDSISYLGKNHANTTGHRVTVLENLGGGAFTHVSGNAGGGGSGSVRIGTSKRGDVPKGWSPDGGLTQPNPKPTDDSVWVYSIQKTGDVFAELAKLDGVPATDPKYDQLLQDLRLARI